MRIPIAFLLVALAFVQCEDYTCPEGKSKMKRVLLSPGDSFSFSSNDEGVEYAPRTKCSVVYKAHRKCKKGISLSCSTFDLPNRDSEGCRRGDRLLIGTQPYCGTNGPDPLTLKGKDARKGVRVLFASNAKDAGAGAKCTAMCLDGVATTTTTESTTSGEPTTTTEFQGTYASNCTCGLAKRDPTKIVGGVFTEPHEYPWQAGLHYYWETTPWCGASLINSKWVLTAAHCTSTRTATMLRVTLGAHTMPYVGDYGEVTYTVSEYFNHPDYDKIYLHNDYAMIKLETPVDFDSYPNIRPVCLPPANMDFAGETATVSGWGTTKSGGEQSETLMEVDVTVLTNEACMNDYKYVEGSITPEMMCAFARGKDSCQGDSGGPLVSSLGRNGVTPGQNYVLIGVVSWGYGCANKKYPGVYARVTEQLEWIQNKALSDGEFCPAQ